MTREEMWKEFENQLIRETRTPITMSYDDAEKLTKLGIKETVAKWKRRLEQTRWIPVSERLPEVGIDVLMCDMEGTMYLSHRASSGNYFDEWGSKIKDIRAWMPLPQPYVPDTNDGKMGESEDAE